MNARHEAALEATAALVDDLRVDLTVQLQVVADLDAQVCELLDSRQATSVATQSDTARARRDAQVRAERAAARGQVGLQPVGRGLGWLNPSIPLAPGAAPAPVTMPAMSVSAEIVHTLRHHVRILGEGPRLLQHAYRRVPSTHPAAYLPVITTDADTRALVTQLVALVGITDARRRLEALGRDLTHLEAIAGDVVHGPPRTNHPGDCPWCGRPSLVTHHRTLGRAEEYIRCTGRHACTCAYPDCPCHRPGSRHRHEWANTGRATNTWSNLATLQDQRQELAMLETRAIDAIGRVLQLHAEQDLLPPPTPDCATNDHKVGVLDGVQCCWTCDPVGSVCAHDTDTAGNPVAYPCATVQTITDDTEVTPA